MDTIETELEKIIKGIMRDRFRSLGYIENVSSREDKEYIKNEIRIYLQEICNEIISEDF